MTPLPTIPTMPWIPTIPPGRAAGVSAPGPVSGSGILLEGLAVEFLLLETGDFILLEA